MGTKFREGTITCNIIINEIIFHDEQNNMCKSNMNSQSLSNEGFSSAKCSVKSQVNCVNELGSQDSLR